MPIFQLGDRRWLYDAYGGATETPFQSELRIEDLSDALLINLPQLSSPITLIVVTKRIDALIAADLRIIGNSQSRYIQVVALSVADLELASLGIEVSEYQGNRPRESTPGMTSKPEHSAPEEAEERDSAAQKPSVLAKLHQYLNDSPGR